MRKVLHNTGIILVLLALLMGLPMLAACGGDDDEKTPPTTTKPAPTVVEPTPTVVEPTPTVAQPTPTQEPTTGPSLASPGWMYRVTYGDDEKIEANTTTWTVSLADGAVEGIESYAGAAAIEGVTKVNFFFPPMGMSFGVDVVSQTLTRDKANLCAVKEDFTLSVKSVGMTIAATRSFNYTGEHGAPFTVGKKWSYTAPVDAPEQGVHLESSYEAEVVGMGEVTVPAGTYDCYKVVHTSGEKTNTEWWAVDGDLLTPVKYVDGTTFVGTVTFEMMAYQAP